MSPLTRSQTKTNSFSVYREACDIDRGKRNINLGLLLKQFGIQTSLDVKSIGALGVLGAGRPFGQAKIAGSCRWLTAEMIASVRP